MARRLLVLVVLCALALVCLRGSWGRRAPAPPASPVQIDPPVEVAHVPVEVPPVEPPPPPVASETAAKPASEPGKKKDVSEKLFSGGLVPRIAITIAPQGMRSLDQDPRMYVEATVDVDGKTYDRVGVHLKGAAGSFRSVRDRPALTLKLNEFVSGQKLHGLRKLHLNNSVQDESYLHELLAGELFRAAGVPAARAGHARVSLNGRDLGLYVLKEAFDRAFLRRHFKDASGNLYDGGFCQDIDSELENDTHRDSDDRSDLGRLVEAAREDDLEERWRQLGQVLDVDRFLSFLAIEVLLWDWDGYPMKPNNYRVYHDPSTSRLVFLPHGMDQLWAQTDGSIHPRMGGLVARALLEIPTGRVKYMERLKEIHAKIVRPEILEQRIAEVRDRLVPAARALRAGRDRQLENRMMAVRDSIHERFLSVERQLQEKPAEPLALQSNGRVSLTSQRWYTEKDTDGVEAREVSGAGGVRQLLVDARGTRCLGSWRCRVLLGRGAYTFTARVRTQGVIPLSDTKGAGAGLRLGGSRTPRQNEAIGDSSWQELRHDFEVRGAIEEVELVCELRATGGRAWFDRSSLAIVTRGHRGEPRSW